jgi:hypothetical protein
VSEEFKVKDSGERQVFDSGMVRDVQTGKIKYHLVTSGPMLKRWAQHLTAGAEKYNDDNWLKATGMEEYNRFRASAYRHFMQWYYNDRDEDHAAAVLFNINGAEYVRDLNVAKARNSILPVGASSPPVKAVQSEAAQPVPQRPAGPLVQRVHCGSVDRVEVHKTPKEATDADYARPLKSPEDVAGHTF